MANLISLLKKIKLSKNNKYAIYVYISRILTMALKFFITLIITKKLNPLFYGKYSYYMTITSYITLFLGLGMIESLARLIVYQEKEKKEEFIGLAYIITFIISLLYMGILYVTISLSQEFFVFPLLIFFTPSIFLMKVTKKIGISTKNIFVLVFVEMLTFVFILISFYFIDTYYYWYLTIYYLCHFIVNLVFIVKIVNFRFVNIVSNSKILFKELKKYGFHLYLGQISSMGTYNLDKIMLNYYFNVELVGYYNLGLVCLSPIITFTESLMSVLYTDLKDKDQIPFKILLANFLWAIIMSLLLATIGKDIFILIFGVEYQTTANLFPLFALISFLSCMYIPFNKFLSIKGFGKYIRNIAFILSAANIIFNILLIPKFGIKGAIIATSLALLIDNISYYYYYYITVKELRSN